MIFVRILYLTISPLLKLSICLAGGTKLIKECK